MLCQITQWQISYLNENIDLVFREINIQELETIRPVNYEYSLQAAPDEALQCRDHLFQLAEARTSVAEIVEPIRRKGTMKAKRMTLMNEQRGQCKV